MVLASRTDAAMPAPRARAVNDASAVRIAGLRRVIQTAGVAAVSVAVGLAALSSARSQEPTSNDAIAPITDSYCNDMKAHHIMGPHAPVGCDRLRLVQFSYVDFSGNMHADGEVVVLDAAAPHVLQIFQSLRRLHFPIAKARPMTLYDGDDDASMNDNNTSAFNDREIVGGYTPSIHAYGLAIDINPIQNPFVTRDQATLTFSPASGADYANRLNDRPWKDWRPGMAESVIEIFAQNGFLIWGGYWDSPIDYQHFQVDRKTGEQLAQGNPADAAIAFKNLVEKYRNCRRSKASEVRHDRTSCIVAANPDGNQP
jgi:hypothetical protein